ncbi:MAG: hypothetical protein M1836_000425 [Candelina mexicana]|nr:MAG: hypothetical protein M1836_000425 [Candelina mexicana]
MATKKPLASKKPVQPSKQQASQNRIGAVSPIIRAPPAQYQSYRQTFINNLATRSKSTLLYQAPSHRAYVLGSYAIGIYFLTYSGYTFYTVYLYPSPDLQVWVPYAMGVVCVFTACLGAWILLGSVRLIRSITAIPVRSMPLAVSLHIESRRIVSLPFVRNEVLNIAPSEFLLSSLLAEAPGKKLSLANREVLPLEKEARKLDRKRFMSTPSRHTGRSVWRALRYLSRLWTREGFQRVLIRGRVGHWQLDKQGGWALEQGRALDRLVNVK